MAARRTEVEDCFSPTQEAWRAREDDGVGCVCEGDEPRACVSEGALECTFMPSCTSAWRAVEDASCVPHEIADPAHPADPEAVVVNLFVVPANGPVTPIDVWLDDVHVVEGYFDYGPSPR